MTGTGEPDEGSDAIWRGWMAGLLSAAAERFELTVTGSPVWGWRDRSVGAATTGADGASWLRVVTETFDGHTATGGRAMAMRALSRASESPSWSAWPNGKKARGGHA